LREIRSTQIHLIDSTESSCFTTSFTILLFLPIVLTDESFDRRGAPDLNAGNEVELPQLEDGGQLKNPGVDVKKLQFRPMFEDTT
jgi:hypothetical protein